MRHIYTPLLFIAIIVFLAPSLSAIKINAQILNSKAQPIADVTVTDGHKRVFSNTRGYFAITTESDSIIVSKLGYARQTLLVKQINPTITLTEKQIVLAPVKVTESYATDINALDKTTLNTVATGSVSLSSELLLKDSSVHSSATKLLGENQTLSLLGNLSRHTLVMLDNVPLNTNGEAFDLSSLAWDTIKRIEIVKGNASLYGGASAIGGIIYLYTNDVNIPSPLKFERQTSYGSFSQIRRFYIYEQKSPIFNFRVSMNKQSAKNNFTYEPRPWWNIHGKLTRHNNSKKQQGVAFQMNSIINKINWNYNLDTEQIYRELPGPVNFLDIYKQAFLTGQNYRQNLNLNYQTDRLNNSLILWQNEDNTGYNNTHAPNPVYLTHYRQKQVSIGLKDQAVYSFDPADVSLGLELSRQSYERRDLLFPSLSIGKTSRQQAAISVKSSLESNGQFLSNNLQAGIRLDDVTEFGTFASWRIEELVNTDTEVELQAGVTLGNSFSLPSFYDLYWKGDAQSLGNPDLEPETSLGGSIWAKAGYTGYSIKAAYYQSEVKKLIQWRQTYLYGTAWKPINIGKAALNNWELEAKAKPFDWINLDSSLTLTQAKDKTNDSKHNLTYTPDIRWISEAEITIHDFRFKLNLDYTGKQWTTPDNLIDPVPAVTLVNSDMVYKYVYKHLSSDIYLQLNNLFDKQYETYAYVPQPGFNLMYGITFRYEM